MYLPIQNALTYPNRLNNFNTTLDLAEVGQLTFQKPDFDRFPCLRLAYEAGKAGGTMPVALNAANEIGIREFLNHKITFMGICKVVEMVMADRDKGVDALRGLVAGPLRDDGESAFHVVEVLIEILADL